jgi:antitoxin FitA
MPSITIKNVPEDLLERLRERAKKHRRSLQAEVLTVLEEAERQRRTLTLEEVRERVRALNLTPRDEAAEIVRADRDARSDR